MATRIRLKRTGAKHNAHYRVVVMDQRKRRDGRTIEEIGHYDPNTDPATVKIDKDRALHWLQVGAVPTDTVNGLLKRTGVIEGGPVPEPEAEDAAREDAVAEEEASEEEASEETPTEDAPEE